MKEKKGLILLLAVMVILIAGAAVLYNRLSEGYGGNLMVQENGESGQEQTEETAETSKGQETEKDASSSQTGNTEEGTQANGEAAENAGEEPVMAPVFSVADAEGNMVHLSDFYGKPIVVNFWASWCGPCKSEMPDFEEAYITYGEDVNFLMVNMTDGGRETVETAQEYIKGQGFTFPVYFDTSQDAAVTYGVVSIPSTYFIDSEGYAVAYAQGAITGDVLQTGLDMIYTP